MKTIGRILAILLAITAVAWATYALGQTSWFAEQFAGGGGGDRDRIQLQDGEGAGNFTPPGFGQGGRPARPDFGGEGEGGFDGRGHDGAGGFNVFALSEFARTLIPMALVITAVVLITKFGDKWRKRRKTAVAPSSEPLTES